MTTYTAHFRTDADWASETITARTPKRTLAKARAFYDGHYGELLFQGYDDGSWPRSERDSTVCRD
jgi:hypothetical protein